MNLSRRKFLSGAAAGVAVMAIPLPMLPSAPPFTMILPPAGPIFSGEIGQLIGIIIREAEEMSGLTPEMLGVR